MGTRRTGNGGNWPPDGDRSPEEQPDPPELSALPPEWGKITIPDDASELAAEAEQVRQELAEAQSCAARFGRRRRPPTEPTIGVPLLIMMVTALITLVSLFAVVWSGSTVQPAPQTPPRAMPPVTVTDAAGAPVTLTTLAPAAILLVAECDCAALVAETVSAAPAGVTVAVIDSSPGSADDALMLVDPDGVVRDALGLSPPTGAAGAVVLVNNDREITYTGRATSVASFRAPLAALTP